MIIADMHSHTHMSGDCKVQAKEMIQAAGDKGLSYYAITDHHDIDFTVPGFELDIPAYIKALNQFTTYAKDGLTIIKGIEFGLEPKLVPQLKAFAKNVELDFIIGSCHLARGKDPYDKSFFDGMTRDQGYQLFFESIVENLKLHEDFDSLAHMDYVIRYWRGDGPKKYVYSDFQDVLDELLSLLIRKDKAMEVNTSGYPYKLKQPHPPYDVLTRYYQLGGRLITIGSDAHMPQNIGSHFDVVEAHLKQIGFDSYFVYKKRKPIEIGF